nr:unnamed protein product [Digitaria exilis]
MAMAAAYYGGRGRGGPRWFVPGADRGLPWGRGGGSSETLAAAMTRRAPPPSAIRRDAVRVAEAAAGEVVLRVHPTVEAERRRQDVIGYLERLIGSTVGCEVRAGYGVFLRGGGCTPGKKNCQLDVFAFGSVPLRTYLPDGDADITVLGNTWLNSSFIDDVRSVLESEQENCDAEFKVTGVHFINAEVKLMKCVVENIVVDVSFNQIGGVSTFCFLELAFYRFLEYFSKFDWDRYGISLNGPVDLSSLPNLTLTAEPTTRHDELLLDQEFLQGFSDRLVVIPNESDGCDTQFRQKFLNIVDPLKSNNNLGRSVSKDKKPLLPFLLSNMLDLSGDLDLHLGCLRKVQYHLESLFDELLQAFEEVYLAGGLDEDSFKIPTMIFKSKSNNGTRLSLVSSTDDERRKLSPVYCSHSTGNDSQQSRAEAQVGVVWQKNLSLSSSGSALHNLPLSSSGLALSSSPSVNSDNYHVSWFCASPKSLGTGTYIPKPGFYSYQDRMTLEREILRGKRQRQRAPGRQYSEQGYFGSQDEHTTTQSATNQSPKKQTSLQQNSYSSKSSIPSGDFVDFKKNIAAESGTKQSVGRDFVDKGRQKRPASLSGMVLPHNGQGNPIVLKACQPSPATVGYQQLKEQAMESLEFGSMGPFSLGIISTQFEEAFPALPTRKRAEEVIVPTSKGPAEAPVTPAPTSTKPVETESRSDIGQEKLITFCMETCRSQEVYQLRDEADFPPLQAGYHRD